MFSYLQHDVLLKAHACLMHAKDKSVFSHHLMPSMQGFVSANETADEPPGWRIFFAKMEMRLVMKQGPL